MSTTRSAPAGAPPMRRRLIGTLLVAVICGSTGHSISMAVGSIVAADLTGSNTWSGLPIAIAALGTALASVPLARLMARFGRRPGLALGFGLAVLGSGLAMLGVLARSFPLLLVGMGLFGISNTSNLLARYAAADVSPVSERGRAIGLIVWGATAGAVIGPMLLGPAAQAGESIGLPTAGSPFLIALVGFGLAGLLIGLLLRPDPLAVAGRYFQTPLSAGQPAARSAPIGEILRRPTVQVAVGALMTSQLVMIATTSTSPVYLRDQGHHVHMIGLAVALHLAGMYATSPLAGWLSDRFGRLPIIVTGALLLIGAIVFAALAPGSDGLMVAVALFLNGVGWNFAFVAGSALLTDSLTSAERPSMQGWADLATGLMGALGSVVGGIILGAWGFTLLNAVGVALVLGPLAVAWMHRSGVGGRESGVGGPSLESPV